MWIKLNIYYSFFFCGILQYLFLSNQIFSIYSLIQFHLFLGRLLIARCMSLIDKAKNCPPETHVHFVMYVRYFNLGGVGKVWIFKIFLSHVREYFFGIRNIIYSMVNNISYKSRIDSNWRRVIGAIFCPGIDVFPSGRYIYQGSVFFFF